MWVLASLFGPGFPVAPFTGFAITFRTYEFRVGHGKLWSTAQGRFGRALRVTGIQHPPPELICSASHSAEGIVMTAPYATTVLDGRRVFSAGAGDPRTEIWFMLYAQVMQADGASYRNILLTHARGVEIRQLPIRGRGLPLPGRNTVRAYEFGQSAIRDRLLGSPRRPTSSAPSLAPGAFCVPRR